MSQQYGAKPQQLLPALQENNHLPATSADVRRGLAVAQVVDSATVTDSKGDVVDTTEFFGRPGAQAEAGSETAEAAADEETADAK
jgi:trigger factor